MNQILMTDDNKPKENKTFFNNKKEKNLSEESKTKSIVKYFAIFIIVFGLSMIGSGSLAAYEQYKENKNYKIPVVSVERKGNKITINAQNEIGIRYLSYSWNSSNKETTIEGKSKKEVETTTNIIPGNNRLNIKVVDTRGKLKQFSKDFIQEDQDITEPEIDISSEGAKIKIVATDDTEIAYIKYKYGDSEEVEVKATEDDPTTITAYVEDVINDTVTLHVEAVDIAKNEKVIDQQIMGVKRPTISVVPDTNDPDYLIITVNAEEGLRMVAFYINEQLYQTDPNTSLNAKEFTYRIKAEKGENGITSVKVNAYSMTEQIQEFKGEYRH